MKLTPGLVGGHCISIDPYYLMHKSEISGYTPNIIRASRKINDEMTDWVYSAFIKFSKKMNIDLINTNITFLGYAFKENCSDVRNTKIYDLLFKLKNSGLKVSLWDPLVNQEELSKLEKKGIKVYWSEPDSIEFAFLCVHHTEVIKFVENFSGPIFDYRNFIFN